jgi:hypothetical protein
MENFYRLTRDRLVEIFTDPSVPAETRDAARLEFDAKCDAAEDR